MRARGSADKRRPASELGPPFPATPGAAGGEAAPHPRPQRGGTPTPTPVQTSARRPGKRPLCARLGTGALALAVSCSPGLGHRGPWADHCSRQALGHPGPPAARARGQPAPVHSRGCPRSCPGGPPRLESRAAFLARLGEAETQAGCPRGAAAGQRLHPGSCFLSVSFVLGVPRHGVSATPARPGRRVPAWPDRRGWCCRPARAGRGPQARPLPMCAPGPPRTQPASGKCRPPASCRGPGHAAGSRGGETRPVQPSEPWRCP